VCGVFFTNFKISSKSNEVSASLLMRGPNDTKILKEKEYLMQFTRLSIRDLANGSQPYLSNDANNISAINGELYNEEFVKNQLRIEESFVPTGDMQILSEYLINDISNLKYVEGMFAGFIYNKVKQKIIFFRDSVGEKPLYYYHFNGAITISSTVSAIIENFDRSNFHLNADSLYKGHSNPGETIFTEVKEVLPGHYLEFDLKLNNLEITRYYEWPKRKFNYTKYEFKSKFAETLIHAAENTTISDVPICMLLSGGLDSAGVLAALNTFSVSPIPAFTLAFENQTYDESALAYLSAKSLGSRHRIIHLSNKELATNISKMLIDLDTPILDPAYLPVYFLTNKIKNNFGFTVAVTGDGGDELFRGYELYKIRKKINLVNSFTVNFTSSILFNVLKLLTFESSNRNSINFLFNRLGTVLQNQKIPWNETALSPFAGTELFEQLIQNNAQISSERIRPRKISSENIENYYSHEILPQVYLKKSDNGSMANGVELRIPYLHKSMIDFGYTISGATLESNPHKWLLKEFLRDRVPHKILDQPKRGFSVPLSGVLSNIPEPKWTLNSLNLSPELCNAIWHRACNGDGNAARAAYGIMVLNSYLQRYT